MTRFRFGRDRTTWLRPTPRPGLSRSSDVHNQNVRKSSRPRHLGACLRGAMFPAQRASLGNTAPPGQARRWPDFCDLGLSGYEHAPAGASPTVNSLLHATTSGRREYPPNRSHTKGARHAIPFVALLPCRRFATRLRRRTGIAAASARCRAARGGVGVGSRGVCGRICRDRRAGRRRQAGGEAVGRSRECGTAGQPVRAHG